MGKGVLGFEAENFEVLFDQFVVGQEEGANSRGPHFLVVFEAVQLHDALYVRHHLRQLEAPQVPLQQPLQSRHVVE